LVFHTEGRTQIGVFQNRVLNRLFGPKRKEIAGGWRKLQNEELRNLYASPNIISAQDKEFEMGVTCSTHGSDENQVQNFGRKTGREETTRKT